MKTLVIHMDDPSTDFLKRIYKNTDWTILTHHIHHLQLYDLIKDHERIVMLGHGSPGGLFGDRGNLIIHAGFAPLLKTKECVCIWCNADQFVEKHELTGLYSGMFISEVIEARFFGIQTHQSIISRSNLLFAEIAEKYIFTENAAEKIKQEYVIENDPIVAFNNDRIYQTKPREYIINILVERENGLESSSNNIISQSDLELIKPVIQAIKDNNNEYISPQNYGGGEYNEDGSENFDDYASFEAIIRYGHLKGFHTFDGLLKYTLYEETRKVLNVTVYEIKNEIKLL